MITQDEQLDFLKKVLRFGDKQIIVITGGPFAGKSTMLQFFESNNFPIITESALEIITELKEKFGLEWLNQWRRACPEKFQELVAQRKKYQEKQAKGGLIFSDRGMYDGIGYYALANKQPSAAVLKMAQQSSYGCVFFLDSLPNFHQRKATGRIHGMAEASHVAGLIYSAYRQNGYLPVRVEVMEIQERISFVIDILFTFEIIKSSWLAQWADLALMFLPEKDRKKIIFLCGAKCAGKSTVGRLYCLLDPSAVFLVRSQRSLDIFYQQLRKKNIPLINWTLDLFGNEALYYSQLEESHPQLALKLNSLSAYSSRSNLLLGLKEIKNFFNVDSQYQVFYQEDRQTAELAEYLTALGRTVVSDNVFRVKGRIEKPDLSNYVDNTYLLVLVYATLADIMMHINKRNARLLRNGDLTKFMDKKEGIASYNKFFTHPDKVSPRFIQPDFVINFSNDTKKEIADKICQIYWHSRRQRQPLK